jgi:hypothetical protein
MQLRNFVGIGIIAVIALVGFLFRDVLSGQAADLKVGDCFILPPADQTEVDEVKHERCTDDHQAEVFFVGDYPGSGSDPFPNDDQLSAFIDQNCLAAFNAYTGEDYDTWEEMDFSAFTPTAEGWSDGDQEITCFLFRVDLASFKGSLKAGS